LGVLVRFAYLFIEECFAYKSDAFALSLWQVDFQQSNIYHLESSLKNQVLKYYSNGIEKEMCEKRFLIKSLKKLLLVPY